MTTMVFAWISDLIINIEFYSLFLHFLHVFGFNREESHVYETLKTVFNKVHQKCSAVCHIFNSLLSVWKYVQTWFWGFLIYYIT